MAKRSLFMKYKVAIGLMLVALLIKSQLNHHDRFNETGRKVKRSITRNISSNSLVPIDKSIPFKSGGVSRSLASESKGLVLVNEVKDELTKYEKCQIDQICPSTETDSRSYEMDAIKPLLEKIKNLNEFIVKDHLRSKELSDLAQLLLKSNDGAMKEEALKLMLSQDPQDTNVKAVSEGVLEYYDSNLVDLAVSELSRHLVGSTAQEVHTALRNCLVTGSLLVRQSMSAKLGPFINQGSYQFYQNLSNKKGLDFPVHQNIQSQIREWELKQSGG